MGLASISSVMKERGYKVDLFDTTYIIDELSESIVSN